MKVSVIIPIYNVSSYIEACLQSVIAQTTEIKIEGILVDDCGTDDSVIKAQSIISAYEGPIEFKLIRHDRNKGLSEARNTGINVATGDYVYFLDSDDELTENCLEKLTEKLSKGQFDFVFANYEALCSWSNMNLNLTIPEGPIYGQPQIADCYHWGWFAPAWNKLIRRDFIIENSLYFTPGILHEDELWSFLLACKAESMYVIHDRTYRYYIRGVGNTITSDLKSDRHLKAYQEVALRMEVYLAESKIGSNANLLQVIDWTRNQCMEISFVSKSVLDSYSLYKRLWPKHGIIAFALCYMKQKIHRLLVAYRHSKISLV